MYKRQHIFTFIVAGHETTATSLSWAVYVLGRHHDIQTKLRDSIGSTEDLDSLEANEYLNIFTTELMRLYPAVPTLFRENSKAFEFKGITYPKGCSFAIQLLGHMHDCEDPLTFNLDRTSLPHAHCSSFWKGHRGCIGKQLALIEFKLILCTLVKSFVIELTDTDVVPVIQVTRRPRQVLVQLHPIVPSNQ